MTEQELKIMNYIKDNWKDMEPTVPIAIPSYKNREGNIVRHLSDLSNNDIYVFVYENDYTESGYDKFDNQPNVHFVKIPSNVGWRCIQRKRHFIQKWFMEHPDIHDYFMLDDDISGGKMWTVDFVKHTDLTLKQYLGVLEYAHLSLGEDRTYSGPADVDVTFGHWDGNKHFSKNKIWYQTFIISNDFAIKSGIIFRDQANICEDVLLNYDLCVENNYKVNSFQWLGSLYTNTSTENSVASTSEQIYIINVNTIKIMKDKTKIRSSSNKHYPLIIKPYLNGEHNEMWFYIYNIINDSTLTHQQMYWKIYDLFKKENKKEEPPSELDGFFE